MLKKKIFLLAALAFGSYSAEAQYSKPAKKQTSVAAVNTGIKSVAKTADLLGVVNMSDTTVPYSPTLLRNGIYHGQKKDDLNIIPKDRLPAYIEDGKNTSVGKKAAETPTIFRNYTGLSDNNYTPPDNTIAVNNDGTVVSAMNSNVRIFNHLGKVLKVTSFFDLFKTEFPTFKQTYYDPKVIYDSGNDRFIMVVLHGSKSDSSRIMVLFSKTKNPLDGWNFYALDGDVLGKNQWTDYPNIGVSNNEFYITGNLFNNNQYYEEPFILQINKHNGYDGKQLTYQAWSGIKDRSGNPSFTLVPVPYGQIGNYGPGTYFVSNEQNNSNAVNLFDLTNDMTATDEKLERTTLTNPFSYSIPDYSSQKGSTDLLNSGDTRIKHALYLNNVIHYVYTSQNNSSNNSTIVYCRLNVERMDQDYRSLGQLGKDYNYPSVASLGADANDQSVLIGFLSSGPNVYPEIRAVHCDNNFEFSSSVLVQDGKSAVNILNDNIERWGDYTGMARKYSTTSVLFAGCFGNSSRWSTRIAEIGLLSNKTGIDDDITVSQPEVTLYPNPAYNEYSVNFTIRDKTHLTIELYDIQGKLVETLYRGNEIAGDRTFSFNSAALKPGLYTLYIRSSENTLAAKKLVIK